MKAPVFACFTAILTTWTISSGYSQNTPGTNSPDSSAIELIAKSDRFSALRDSTFLFPFSTYSATAPTEVKTKVMKSFKREYKNIADAKWITFDEGIYLVSFTSEGVKTSLRYNNRGRLQSRVRYYREDNLPEDVRNLVKSTYYDFNIVFIIEPTINGITSYLVKVEDKTCWKNIKVVGGEMEVMEEYSKK